MQNRRAEQRMICADLIDVQWKDKSGRVRRTVANLEDISIYGACVQVDTPIAPATILRISYPKGELMGKVCYCIYRDIGYFLGIEFEPGSRWSVRQYRPQHMLDARRLFVRSTRSILDSPETDLIQ